MGCPLECVCNGAEVARSKLGSVPRTRCHTVPSLLRFFLCHGPPEPRMETSAGTCLRATSLCPPCARRGLWLATPPRPPSGRPPPTTFGATMWLRAAAPLVSGLNCRATQVGTRGLVAWCHGPDALSSQTRVARTATQPPTPPYCCVGCPQLVPAAVLPPPNALMQACMYLWCVRIFCARVARWGVIHVVHLPLGRECIGVLQ